MCWSTPRPVSPSQHPAGQACALRPDPRAHGTTRSRAESRRFSVCRRQAWGAHEDPGEPWPARGASEGTGTGVCGVPAAARGWPGSFSADPGSPWTAGREEGEAGGVSVRADSEPTFPSWVHY